MEQLKTEHIYSYILSRHYKVAFDENGKKTKHLSEESKKQAIDDGKRLKIIFPDRDLNNLDYSKEIRTEESGKYKVIGFGEKPGEINKKENSMLNVPVDKVTDEMRNAPNQEEKLYHLLKANQYNCFKSGFTIAKRFLQTFGSWENRYLWHQDLVLEGMPPHPDLLYLMETHEVPLGATLLAFQGKRLNVDNLIATGFGNGDSLIVDYLDLRSLALRKKKTGSSQVEYICRMDFNEAAEKIIQYAKINK